MSYARLHPADHEGKPEYGQAQTAANAAGVSAALAALLPEHREIMMLRECRGLGYDEIARVLGVSRGAVSERLAAARTSLLGRMNEVRQTHVYTIGRSL